MARRNDSGVLERALRRLRPRRLRENCGGPRYRREWDAAPTSAFDVQVQERVRGLEASLKEVKDRVNGLIFLVVGAVVVQVVLRFVS